MVPTSQADLAQSSANHHMAVRKQLAGTERAEPVNLDLSCPLWYHQPRVAFEHLRCGLAEQRRAVPGTRDFPALALKTIH